MSEPDFDIDAAENAYNEARGEEAPAADDTPPNHPEANAPAEEDPPGFKTFEEYVADGGDPDNYVGKKAYEQHYSRIQDNKALRGEVKGLQETVQQTMEATNT
ncbi:MAG: hypothetical protein ACR2PR_11630, partial [Pseudohongiellaceae bacterium]